MKEVLRLRSDMWKCSTIEPDAIAILAALVPRHSKMLRSGRSESLRKRGEVQFRPERVDWTADEIALTPGYLACFEFEEEVKAATIPVEKTCGPILMLSVEDDQMWPSKEFAEVAEARLREHDFRREFEHVCYKDAGHIAVLAPFVSIYLPAQVHPVIGRMFAFGGNLLANQKASEDAWRRTLERLNTTFRTG